MAVAGHKTRGVSLLLVEDEAQARQMMVKSITLKYPGMTLHVAENGAEGLELYRRQRPDIVVTDISMPVLDGIAMSREIKELNRDAIIAAVTAHSDSSFLLSAIEIGINHYLLKPVDHRQFFTLLDKLIDNVLLKRLVADQDEYIRKLSRAVEQSQSMVVITDSDGIIEFVNRKFCEFTGYAADEVIGVAHGGLAEGTSSEVGEEIGRAIEAGTEWRGELIGRKKDGELYYELASISPIKDEAGAIVNVVAVKQDITAAKEQEAEFRTLKNYLADVVNSMPAVLVGLDRQERVTQWNRQAEILTGLSGSKALGRPLRRVLPEFAALVRELLAGMEETRQPKGAGLVLERGEEHLSFDVVAYPLTTEGEGAVLKIEDVTERVRTQELALQSEKMASLGRLAFGMAHEVNNPLHAISQASRIIERRLAEDSPGNRKVAGALGVPMVGLQGYFKAREIGKFTGCIREATAQAAHIINSILRLSHAEKAPMEPASPVQVVEQALEQAARSFPSGSGCDFGKVEMVREYQGDLSPVPMVAVEIEQVLVNVFVNAVKAMCDRAGGPAPRLVVRLSSNHAYHTIEVEDNGAGMEESVRRRVFEPFFSTRELGEGTGLGLSVSFWIVTQVHKGEMTVDSQPGSGTRVTIKLPLA